jgi:hypothetical protein
MIAAFFSCYSADEEHFPESYANVYCLRVEECARGVYESEYDGEMEECVSKVQDIWEEIADFADKFDDDDAVECLDELRSESCGDWAEGEPDECAKVYAISFDDWF